MVSTITTLPEAPSRNTQDQAAFVATADNFLGALVAFVPEMNTSIGEINSANVTIANLAQAASDDADRAEAAAGYRVSIGFKTYAALAAVTGTNGQLGAVFGPDAGTHTDPVVGGTVANIGIYRYSTSPAGWEWVSDGSGATVDWSEITGKPTTFTPSAHTHVIANVTGLQSALDGKALVGAVGSSGLTMTSARLLGRSTAATGAVEEITIGSGLSLTAGVLSYSGGSSMVYPGAGIAVSTGSAWSTSLAVPTGALVGTTASQTLTNKTLGSGTSLTGGTDSGVVKTGGDIQASVSIVDAGSISSSSPGFRGTPKITATTRTLGLTDAGKLIHASGNVTIPDNGSVGFPVGTAIEISNSGSSPISILITTDTLRWAGTASTGTRTLAGYGLAYLKKVDTNEWKIAGAGVS